MLTPRDLKPGDSLFFSTPPPEFQWTPRRTLYVVLHAEHTIKIRDPGGGGGGAPGYFLGGYVLKNNFS